MNALFRKKLFPFYKSAEIKNFFEIISKNETDKSKDFAMFVGGCVRNFLKDETIKDIDIATIFPPEIIKEKFKNTKFKIIETGLEHGTLTVVGEDFNYELTTLRKDITTDGRHAEVEFSADWTKDSERRDFTINAIYLNKNGKIFDPQSGLIDLKNNIVKFIGDPQTRIKEDFLRIIRFLRFTIQYNSSIEHSTVQAIKLNLNGVKALSKERVLSELLKILKLENFSNLIDIKELMEIFVLVFPEFKYINRLKNFNVIKNRIENTEILLLSILLIDLKDNHEYFCHKYKLSNKIYENLKLLGVRYRELKSDKEFFKKNIKNNAYNIGLKNLKILFAIFLLEKNKISAKELEFFQMIEKISIPKFPFDGKFLLKRGIQEGKKIGFILKKAEKIWVENNFNLSNEDFETIIKKNTSLN